MNLSARNAIDPIDGIMHMRRILAHIATAPNNLNFNDMVAHIVSKVSGAFFLITYYIHALHTFPPKYVGFDEDLRLGYHLLVYH